MVDWNDATFRTGFNQDYNASISGATERVNYYFSLGYINNEGAVQGNEYNAFRSNMKNQCEDYRLVGGRSEC